MNTVSANLLLTRNAWLTAFYAADVEQLYELETEWFLSTNGRKFLYKEIQLNKIAASKGSLAQLKRRESNVLYREFNGIAVVTGKAEITDDDEVLHTNFIENWIKIDGEWKLQFISFESE
ncbi:nuclear transport factor 2 family protein [Pseudescherichia sp.]|uniref:nuclear transport factor 2 family protein n=1 Tax=Pseudescherichia sp. TaxID=2055881 RepID=UPI00289BFEB1|nr:nuclear transport factor 2 family protein [Pseudescherichia sp.]